MEVLIALLIFSLGLMGVAAWLLMSARSVHAAYLRTQVTLLAQGMADRMSANVSAVWSGYYDGTYPAAGQQRCAERCTPRQWAESDKAIWSSQLASYLPAAATATIHCGPAGLSYVPAAGQMALRPPYGGNCSMTITWTERAVASNRESAHDASAQTFAWDFQP